MEIIYDELAARTLLETINLQIIGMAGKRMQTRGGETRKAVSDGRYHGDRQAASIAAGPVQLAVLPHMTPPGHKTAVRALPPVLAAIPKNSPRRKAADLVAHCWEKIATAGSAGGDVGNGGDIKGHVPDGGATTGVKHVARRRAALDAIRAVEVYGTKEGRPQYRARIVLAPQRGRGKRKEITAITLLTSVCVEGRDMAEILRRAGWSDHSKHRKMLGLALLNMLDDLAAHRPFMRAGAN